MTYLAKSNFNASRQVYLYDFTARTNIAVSRKYNSSGVVSINCDSTAISADGRFVAFQSAAPDIDPVATNGLPQIFLFDRLTGQNQLLTASRFGNAGANNRSLAPVFSSDGQTLFVQSWAEDLGGADHTQMPAIFGYPF
jgi:Tol biopolymer transport system component